MGCERVCYDRVCHAMECVAVLSSSYLGVPVTVIDDRVCYDRVCHAMDCVAVCFVSFFSFSKTIGSSIILLPGGSSHYHR